MFEITIADWFMLVVVCAFIGFGVKMAKIEFNRKHWGLALKDFTHF